MVSKSELRILVAGGSSSTLTDSTIEDLISMAQREVRGAVDNYELEFDEDEYPARDRAVFWLAGVFGLISTGQVEDMGFTISEVELRSPGQNPKFDWFRSKFTEALADVENGTARFGIQNDLRSNRVYGDE